MKKSILITLVAVVAIVFLTGFIMVFRMNGNGKTNSSDLDQMSSLKENAEIIKNNQLESSKEATSFNGVVGSITSPGGLNIKILQVNGTIDDFEVLKNMSSKDFEGGSVEIPTIEKNFKVVVDDKTKLIGFENLSDIKSGDQIRVDAGKDPKEIEEFTALEMELNFRAK